jgi:hypothetical protein
MQFSIYSELQTWPGKTQQQIYAEALEQVVNADRLGYSTYSIIEHFFFPEIWRFAQPVRVLRKMLRAHQADQVSNSGARAALS